VPRPSARELAYAAVAAAPAARASGPVQSLASMVLPAPALPASAQPPAQPQPKASVPARSKRHLRERQGVRPVQPADPRAVASCRTRDMSAEFRQAKAIFPFLPFAPTTKQQYLNISASLRIHCALPKPREWGMSDRFVEPADRPATALQALPF